MTHSIFSHVVIFIKCEKINHLEDTALEMSGVDMTGWSGAGQFFIEMASHFCWTRKNVTDQSSHTEQRLLLGETIESNNSE